MRNYFFLCFLGLVLVGLPGAAWAFDRQVGGSGGFQSQLLEIKKTQLGPALGVDQRTVDQLIRIDQKYSPLKEQCRQEARTAFFQLQQLMRNPSPSQEEVRAVLDTIMRKEQEMTNLKHQENQEEMAILTPVQQARYIMYLVGLRQQVSREARTLKGAPGSPGAPRSMTPITPGPEPREVVRPTQ